MHYTSNSLEDTKRIAGEIAATLRGGETLLLQGEMGAGKTTFTQGLVEALGGKDASSPTFSILNVYQVSGDRFQVTGIKQIAHLDLYRLKKLEEIEMLGLEEWLGRKDTIVCVEWPDAVEGVEWPQVIRFLFSVDGHHRTIQRV